MRYVCKMSKAGDIARTLRPRSYVLRFTYERWLVYHFLRKVGE